MTRVHELTYLPTSLATSSLVCSMIVLVEVVVVVVVVSPPPPLWSVMIDVNDRCYDRC